MGDRPRDRGGHGVAGGAHHGFVQRELGQKAAQPLVLCLLGRRGLDGPHRRVVSNRVERSAEGALILVAELEQSVFVELQVRGRADEVLPAQYVRASVDEPVELRQCPPVNRPPGTWTAGPHPCCGVPLGGTPHHGCTLGHHAPRCTASITGSFDLV